MENPMVLLTAPQTAVLPEPLPCWVLKLTGERLNRRFFIYVSGYPCGLSYSLFDLLIELVERSLDPNQPFTSLPSASEEACMLRVAVHRLRGRIAAAAGRAAAAMIQT